MVVGCMLSHLQRWWKQLEVVEWLEKFCNLSACPRPWACTLTLLTNADIKADITLLCNIISKQKSCSFNILIYLNIKEIYMLDIYMLQ